MNAMPSGTPLVLLVVLLALVAFAAALWRRSWPVWLFGFVLLLAALVTAWRVRDARSGVPVPSTPMVA